MAYSINDIKNMTRKRGTTSASSSNSDRYSVDDIKGMTGAPRRDAFTDYAQMATRTPVQESKPSFRYNSYSEYENAINAVKPTGLDNAGYRAKGLWNSIADINRALPSLTPKWRDSVNQRKEYTDKEQEYADLTKEFELYKQDRGNVFREYNDRYKNNGDFAEKSQTLPAAINAVTMDTFMQNQAKTSGNADSSNRIAAYNNMSDDEKALANYLANTDLKAFWKYMSDMNAIEDKEIYEQGVQKKKAAIDEEPLIGAYYSAEGMANKIANAPAIPVEYALNAATGARQNPYSGAAGYANMGWDEQQLVSEKIREETGSDVLPFLYNTGVSIGESLLGAGTFGEGYSVLMGTSAFNNSYKELEERGASDAEIMTGALLAGAAETVFEKVSLENLLSPKDITSLPTLIRETLKQAGVEGSEELFTELSNIITDEISQGANSEINKMINEMRGNGVSEDEIKKTISDYIGRRIVESTLGGMLSGGAMGGVYNGANYAYNTEIGRNTNRAELASAIENMDRRSKTRRAYENAGRNLDNMKDAEVGAMAINALNEASSLDRDAYGNALVDNLVAAGLSKEDASKIKDAYFKQKRSKTEEGYFDNSVVAEAVEKTWNEKGVELLNKANENAKRIARTVTNKTGVAKLLKKSDLKVGARTELNGEEVKVKDVIKDGDTIKVVTENGEVNPKDLTLSANDAAMVVAASGIDNEVKRQAYFANYDGVQNVAEYTESFDAAYRYGRLGMSEEQLTEDLGKSIHLTAEQAVNAFVKGQNEANTTSEKLDESLKSATKELEGFRKGKLTFDNVDVKSLNATQRGAVVLAEAFNNMGINVVLFNDSSDDSENGRYENGTVYINLSARYYKNAIKFDKGYVINTMAHELTHWMEDTAKTEFKALKKAIFDYYGEEETKKLIAKEQQRQKGLSDPAAESEVVARACEDMLSNPDTLEKIMMGIDTNTRQTIIDKFKEFFEKLGRFLKNALSMNSQSDAARMLRENAEVFEQVRQQWIKTFTEAVNTVQKIEQAYDDVTEDYTEETHPKFSDKVTAESTEHLMAIHNIGEKQLLKTISMGGFACPSIAILKQYMPHNEFGDISIVFSKATINPKLRWNSVFSGDAYTPIFPTVEKKLSRDKQYAIEEKIRNLVGGDEMFRIIGSPSLDYDNMTDKLNRFETAADAYRYTDELKYAYLKDIGKDVSIPTKDYAYMPNEISNDAIGAIALVLGKDTVKEMYEGGSTWYNNHPEEVDKLRLRLNEAFIKEHNAEDYKSKSLKELYHNYFNDEDGKLSFRNYDTAVRAMYAMTTNGVKQVKDSVALKKMLDENVEQEAFDKWLNDLFEGVVEKEGFRNDVDLFTASGKRRSWEALHDEITLENVVKYMRKQEPSGIGMMGANIFGGATKKYASIEDMRKDIARLMLIAEDEMDKKRTEISNKTHDLIYEVVGNAGDAFSLSMRHDDVYKMFVEAIRKYRTVEGINSYLHKEGDGYYNITDDVAPKLLEIVKEIEQLPTGYFEAKPLRGVSLDEIAYVVIPDNSSQDLINALDENGIQHYTYDHESEDNRVEVTNEHADVESGTLFSSKVDSEGHELTEEQQKYFAESKIVDDNGNLLVMYHGTDSYDNFTVFKAGKNGYLGKGMYFTEKDYIAKKYAEQNGYDGRVYKVYLNVTNPLIVTSDNPALEILGEKVAARRAQKNSYSTRWLTPADIKKLQDKGYDGIVWKYGKSPIEVSVWDSNQVKLTTNENPTDNPDIRYSSKVDSDGNNLTDQQIKYFSKSEIRDDDDNLLVVYHGTPSGGFTVFNGAMNYFTANKAYAERYTRGSGSGRRGDNPQMYKGYLNIVKPFTLSDSEAKRIYIDEYIKGGYAQGINPLSSKAEIEQYAQTIDWVEADNLKEFFDEKGYDYDGIILNEGGDLTDNGTVMRGDSYVTFASNQFKSVENKNPTDNEDIRYSLKDIGYHAGDLGKSESLGNQKGSNRGTGHFGTGTYFVGNEEKINIGNFAKRPHEVVDFSKYNLYRPLIEAEARELHDFLGDINHYAYYEEPSYKGYNFERAFDDFDYEADNLSIDEAYGRLKGLFRQWVLDEVIHDISEKGEDGFPVDYEFTKKTLKKYGVEKIINRIYEKRLHKSEADVAEEYRKFKNKFEWMAFQFRVPKETIEKVYEEVRKDVEDVEDSDYVMDSASTLFMKKLGYEGVDVRHIPSYDNTRYGSVIYDLKGEDLERKKEIGTARFSSKVDDPIFEILGLNKKLEKENKALKADVDALKEYIRLDAELSNGKKWNPVELNSVSKYLADKYNSDTDMIALRKSLATAYTYITEQLSNGNESWEDIMDECYSVATDVYNDIKNKPTISKTRITNEIQKAGIKADADVIKEVQNAVTLATQEEYVRQIAVDIYNGYWKASNLKTQADIKKEATNKLKSDKTKIKQAIEKKDKEIQRLKFEHRKTIDWMLAEQKLADQIHYGKVIEQVREDREKKLTELKQFVKDRDARLKNAAERRKIISKITEVSEDLSKRLLKGEKGKKVPQALKAPLAELLTAIDFSSKQLLGINAIKKAGIETKRDIAMSALLNRVSLALQGFNEAKAEGDDAYELAGLHLPPNYATTLQEIADTIAKVEQTAEGTYVLQYMTAEQLDDLYKAIKAIRTAINNANRIISANNAHEVDYLGNEIMTYLDKLGQRKIDNKVTQFMEVANKTPYYFFKHMGRGGQEVFSFLQNGWDKLADNVEVIKNFTRGKNKDGSDALYTSQEYEKWKNTVHEFDVLEAPTPDERAEGKEGRQRHITMTEAQIMALYCLSKREQAMLHISRDGIVIDEIKTKKKYGKHEIKKQDTVTLAPTDLEKILSVVTNDARMKQVADKIQEFMSTVCAEWGNEVTMKLYGTEEFTEKNYFPIHVNQEVLSSEAKNKSHSIYGMLNQSFTKPLNDKARNEINIADIFDVFNAHASDMAKYNALALPIMDVIKVWNYKENLDRGDNGQREVKAVKKSITKAIGKAGNSYISGLLRDLNGDAESGRYDKTSMRLVKNYKTAAVAANIQTALLQPLAYIRAGYMVNPKYLRKALTRKPKINECIRDLGVQKWKSMGFYDTNLTRGLDKIISNSDSLFDTIVDKSLWLTEKMDEVTWGYLYTAVELETKDKYPSLSGEKLKEQTIKRLRDVVYGTQVFDSTLARTAMMRSTSSLVQMETSFGAEPILSVNMLMDAATEFNQEARRTDFATAVSKKGKLLARASVVYLVASVVESALRAALKKIRDYDDEDDTFEGLTSDILERTLEELDVLNKIPWVKEAMPYIRKFVYKKLGFEEISKSIYADNSRMDTEVFATIDSAIKSIDKALEGENLTYKDVQKISQALSQTSGLPISNVIKEFKVVWNNTVGRITGNTIK